MKNLTPVSLGLLTLTFLLGSLRAQVKEIGEANVAPTPEIKRLYEALGGDWDTSEKREHTQFFPNGGERKGKSHVRLAAGGAVTLPASKIQAVAARCAAQRTGTGTNLSTIIKRSSAAKR
jgi:hypothetical protein